MQNVTGMGIYLRRLKPRGPAAKLAATAARHGVTHVQILGAWQEPDKQGRVRTSAPNRKVIREYTAAFADVGIACGLWFYPWAGHEARLIDALHEQSQAGLITSLLNDAELGYKWRLKGAPRAREAVKGHDPSLSREAVLAGARELVRGIDRLTADMPYGHGFTSYGIPSFHPNFPWDIFAPVDFVSPQLYRSTKALVARGVKEWRARSTRAEGTDAAMLPSIGAFGPKSKSAMAEHIRGFFDPRVPSVDGFLVWSWMQVDREEWGTIEQWGKWIRDRACS